MLNNFLAIDFETANRERSSVCSVGVVLVEEHKIVDQFYSLIKPEPNYYSRFNTAVHGLSARDTNSAPLFPEVWAQIAPFIKDYPLVAHNSPFDESCLKSVFAHYQMVYPTQYHFLCTCRASRRINTMLPNHKLDTVAAHYGFDLHNHHHALADALACAHIALNIF